MEKSSILISQKSRSTACHSNCAAVCKHKSDAHGQVQVQVQWHNMLCVRENFHPRLFSILCILTINDTHSIFKGWFVVEKRQINSKCGGKRHTFPTQMWWAIQLQSGQAHLQQPVMPPAPSAPCHWDRRRHPCTCSLWAPPRAKPFLSPLLIQSGVLNPPEVLLLHLPTAKL